MIPYDNCTFEKDDPTAYILTEAIKKVSLAFGSKLRINGAKDINRLSRLLMKSPDYIRGVVCGLAGSGHGEISSDPKQFAEGFILGDKLRIELFLV